MDGANAEADPQAMAAIRAEVFMVIEVLVVVEEVVRIKL